MEKFNSPIRRLADNQERHTNIPEKVRRTLKGMRNSAIAGSALVFAMACNGKRNSTPIAITFLRS